MAHEWTASEIRLFKLAKPYLAVMHNDLHTKEAVRFAFKLLDLARTLCLQKQMAVQSLNGIFRGC